uniref:Odorant receptor n=1 Tax=Anopheles coluzzii TaxID=1518534 RepID=A0A6E8W705_ANOCL
MFHPSRWMAKCRVWYAATFKFSADADYFFLVQPLCRSLQLFGNPVRCLQEFGTVRGLFVQLCRFLFLLPYASFALKAYWQLNHPLDTNNSILTYGSFVIYMLWAILIWVLNHYEHEMCELRLFFKNPTYQEQSDWAHRIRAGNYRRWNWMILMFYLFNVINVSIFTLTNAHNRQFHFQTRGEVVGPLYFQIIVEIFTGYLSLGYFVPSCITLMTLQLFRTEMHILTTTLKQAANEEQQQQQHQHAVNIRCAYHSFCKQFYANIRRHTELLQSIATFSKVFSPISVLLYYGALITITCTCFYVMKHDVSTTTVCYAGFAVYMLFNTLLFCKSIDSVNDLHTEVGYIMYSEYWPATLQYADQGLSSETLRPLRRSILIVLQQTLRPLRFGYGVSGSLSMQRFGEFMQQIYSLIMFLAQLN